MNHRLRSFWSCCHTECLGDELRLAENISLRQPSDLPLADDVHCFVPSDRTQGAFHRPEPLAGDHPLLHKAMVLFDDVVQIRCSPASAILAQLAGLLELINGGRVRWMAIHVDHPWPTLTNLQNRQARKSLAAVRSRLGESRKLIVFPAESMARYKQVHRPATRTYV
jgi:hypothetical protein